MAGNPCPCRSEGEAGTATAANEPIRSLQAPPGHCAALPFLPFVFEIEAAVDCEFLLLTGRRAAAGVQRACARRAEQGQGAGELSGLRPGVQ